MPRACGLEEAAAGGVQGGERASGGGGGVSAGGWGAGWAAAPAPLQPPPLGRGGRGARRRELGHCGSRSPRLRGAPLRCASARGAPSRRRLRCRCRRSSAAPAPRVRHRGAGLAAGSPPGCTGCAAPDLAGRPRPSPSSGPQREGGLIGTGIAAVRASHLQSRRRAAPSARTRGFPRRALPGPKGGVFSGKMGHRALPGRARDLRGRAGAGGEGGFTVPGLGSWPRRLLAPWSRVRMARPRSLSAARSGHADPPASPLAPGAPLPYRGEWD